MDNKILIDQECIFYTEFFSNYNWISLEEKFKYEPEEKNLLGKIITTVKKNKLEFDVVIPLDYPFGRIQFVGKDFKGYPHQNFDDSLCLNTPFSNHLYSRLELEVDRLEKWILEYYLQDNEDQHYEYPAFDATGRVQLIFQEKNFADRQITEDKFGTFQYSILNWELSEKGKIENITAICQNIGNEEQNWSSHIKSLQKYKGLWIFVEEEPIYSKKHKMEFWKDLIPLMPIGFDKYFSTFCKKYANYKLGPKGFETTILLIIGYKIPGINGTNEVHWDLILLPRKDFPRRAKIHELRINKYTNKIAWDITFNSSYDRFFGRGGLSKAFTDAKCLIIGIGAIGSSLAEILVRGGVRYLDLSDIDHIEPGNICRSGYSFNMVGKSKVNALKDKLCSISPFVNINSINFIPISDKSLQFKEKSKALSEYDFIFDCTANNEILQSLFDLNIDSSLFSISMSDRGKEMVCVTNKKSFNIVHRRNQMFYSFGNFKEATFREGTGCWHPTFEAAFFDINQLLHFLVRKLDLYFVKEQIPVSFYVYYENGQIGCSEDRYYIQDKLGLKIIVESSCLKKIEHLAYGFYPNEFGGSLIGSYLDNYTEVVISDIIIPEDFFNTPMLFEPDHNSINKQLEQIYQEFNGIIEYLGDWHTHPNGTNNFSRSDYESIRKVALSSKVNTHNPILLIASFGENFFDLGFYVYNDDNLLKYREIFPLSKSSLD